MTATEPFGRRLTDACRDRGPLCAGIDPHPALLDAWGLDPTAAGLERFAMTTIEALAGHVAVLKPQSAFFEAFGSAGIAVLEKVLAAGRQAGALMLLDAKRGDIGSTMAAYAAAYLTDTAPLAADALTVSPFLGVGALRPAVDAALASGRGLFVLCRTSNPEGDTVQLATCTRATVAQSIVDDVAALSADDPGATGAGSADTGSIGTGSIGLVVGATVTSTGIDLTRFPGPLLAPGIGAQGATAADLRRVFGAALPRVLPTASRSILSAGPSITALRDAADRTLDDVRAAIAG